MLIRYKRDSKNRTVKKGVIYTVDEHKIKSSLIDQDVLAAMRRLRSHGYEAYLVGGAVRDLIKGGRPKDFDLVTDAWPNKIKKIFRNSRIIGKRFKLVHLYFKNEKIIEIATFRSREESEDSPYGTIDDDFLRRDFTINALYYSAEKEQVIDLIGGVRDLERGVLKSVRPLSTTFQEDPVRLIRAVKYAVGTECQIPLVLKRKIKRSAPLLEAISPSRMTEEIFKILLSGKSLSIFKELEMFKLARYILPEIEIRLDKESYRESFYKTLTLLDSEKESIGVDKNRAIFYLLAPFMETLFCETQRENSTAESLYKPLMQAVKKLIFPMLPPNVYIEKAIKQYNKEKNFNLTPPSVYYKNRRQQSRRNQS